jgi:hypothetical protein
VRGAPHSSAAGRFGFRMRRLMRSRSIRFRSLLFPATLATAPRCGYIGASTAIDAGRTALFQGGRPNEPS